MFSHMPSPLKTGLFPVHTVLIAGGGQCAP